MGDTHVSECNLLSAKDNRGIGPDGRTSVEEGSGQVLMEPVGYEYGGSFQGSRGNNFNRSKCSFDVFQGYLRIPLVRGLAIRLRKSGTFSPLLVLLYFCRVLSGSEHVCAGIAFEFLCPLFASENHRVPWIL